MQCHHFDAGRCRSCTLIPVPHAQQVADAQARIRALLAPFVAGSGTPADGADRAPAAADGPGPGSADGADGAENAADGVWLPPIRSREAGFRAKAKMVVTGTAQEPRLGLLPPAPGEPGVDLVDCPLYPPAMQPLLEGVRALIRRAQVPPYSVARRRGELKHVLATVSPDGQFLLRLVLRTDGPLPRIREHLPRLLAEHPEIAVVTANLLPEHRATTEGATDIHLAGGPSLPMRTGEVTLRARPQSFLQTNTGVAAGLYRQAAAWVADIADERESTEQVGANNHQPAGGDDPGFGAHAASAERPAASRGPLRIWDLYCGLGGFALHAALAAPDAEVTGVEVSEQAILGAREAAADLKARPAIRPVDPASPIDPADPAHPASSVDPADPSAATEPPTPARRPTFLAADATRWAITTAASPVGPPDVVIVNPPRRGIGRDLAAWLEGSGVRDVIYSSCNPDSLVRDLAMMPSLRILAGRYADMFPHTTHAEVIVHLRRTPRRPA